MVSYTKDSLGRYHFEEDDQAEATDTDAGPVNLSGGLDPTQMIPTEGMPDTADLDWERRIGGRRALQADYRGGRLDVVTATLHHEAGTE